MGEGQGNRTRMDWVEASCLTNRPDPRRAGDGEQQGQRRLAVTPLHHPQNFSLLARCAVPTRTAHRARSTRSEAGHLDLATGDIDCTGGALRACNRTDLERRPIDCLESRWWELNPTTLVWRTSVSPQHFTCLAVPEGPELRSTLASGDTAGASCVGREGIEPSFRRSKNPVQSQRLLPTRDALARLLGPTPRN